MIRTIIILGLLTSLLVGCSAEAKLKNELEAANYCETKNDCVLIGSKCPFDCYIYVNADKADILKSKVEAYESKCEYSCLACADVACVEGKCELACA